MSIWMTGLQGLILGLGTVFLVLLALIVFIKIMGSVVGKLSKKPTAEKVDVQEIKEIAKPENDEDEVIAAITAAIACMAQREGKKFKIRSFRRV